MKELNCCIVCYKNVQSLSPSKVTENGECVTARFVRLFQRHVTNFSMPSTQIKIEKADLTFLSSNASNNEPIKLQTCADCNEILSVFNFSYGDLKYAEMEANWSLHQLANIIRFANYVPARLTKFRESVKDVEKDNRLIDDAIETIGKFRKQLQQQCQLQYKNQFPRVVLMKPSRRQILTSDMFKTKYPPDGRIYAETLAQSKNHLISQALSNLTSLQLILYLALFDPVIIKTEHLSNANIESQEYDNNLSYRLQSHTKHKIKIESSLSSSPSSAFGINDNVNPGENKMKGEWIPGYSVECSRLNGHYSHNDHIYLTGDDGIKDAQANDNCNTTNDKVQTKEERFEIPNQRKSRRVATHSKQGTDKYRCKKCGKRYKNAVSLSYHKKTHSRPESWKHSCRYCGKKFITKGSMKSHLRVHTGEKPFKCPVAGCEKDFAQTTSLKLHREKYHKSDMDDKHQDENTNGVVITRFLRKRKLNLNSTIFRCNQCGKQLKNAVSLWYHKKTHSEPETWKHSCRYCGKKFITKGSMQSHLRVHGDNSIFRCNQCGKQFKNAVSLWYHKKTHSEPETWKHSCRYCGKKFIRKGSMKSHLRTHTGEKPFKCSAVNCNATFSFNKNLQQHLQKRHPNSTGDKTHCGKTDFTQLTPGTTICSSNGNVQIKQEPIYSHIKWQRGEDETQDI